MAQRPYPDDLAWLESAAISRPQIRGIDPSQGLEDCTIVGRADLAGGDELILQRNGGRFSILFNGDELMGDVAHVSEEALAVLAHSRTSSSAAAVLIGGLGMGYTLRAALSAWGDATTVLVAELVPEVLDWARGPLAHLYGDCLKDPRLTLELSDVHDVIARAEAQFDAILLDVDNGPDGFIRPANDRLYCNWGARSTFAALKPGGVLAIWSAYKCDALYPTLVHAGFVVEEIEVPAYLGSTIETHSIWIASKSV